MKVTRDQVANLARALEADPTIEAVEVRESEKGRVSFWRPETVVQLTRIRVTPRADLAETLGARAGGKTRVSA